jgi:hypothetical protein
MGAHAAVVEAHYRCRTQYPLTSYHPWQEREDELRNCTSFLEDAERRRCDRVREEWQRRCGMVDQRENVGGMTVLARQMLHRAHRAPMLPTRTLRMTSSFKLGFASCKI